MNFNSNTNKPVLVLLGAGSMGTPEEIGAAGAFLLSDEAAFITGTDLLIDGGVIAAIESGKYDLTVR